MPRKPRMYIAGMPYHVIQRGNDRQACFYGDDDYQFYLECLKDASERYKVSVHSYVLMTNHVHMLLTPEHEDGITLLMQSLGRRYVQYINKLYKRTGTLWEGRHKASVVDAEKYLFSCYRYIELNPVAAGMVAHPSDYRWSSYRANVAKVSCDWLKPHPLYLGLGLCPSSRASCYQSFFDAHMPVQEMHAIRNAAERSMPLGDSRFKDQIEVMLDRKIGYLGKGRPRKLLRGH